MTEKNQIPELPEHEIPPVLKQSWSKEEVRGVVLLVIFVFAVAAVLVAVFTQNLIWIYTGLVLLLFGTLFRFISQAADKSTEMERKKRHKEL